jgi:hypothetical protein
MMPEASAIRIEIDSHLGRFHGSASASVYRWIIVIYMFSIPVQVYG